MGFFLGLLKLLFGKRELWTPLFMLSDCEDDEGPQLRFDCEGDYTGECCEILDRLYVFDETPPVCRTPREAQALRKRPCRFTAEYTPYDGALIFRDICSGTARQDIIQTVQAVCREHGKEPDVYLKEETDE